MSLAPHLLVAGALATAAPGDTVPVPPDALHHLRRVLRRAEGSAVRLTDGAGRLAEATLTDGGATLVSTVLGSDAPHPRLTLVQALAKGRRAEDAVRVACELGVDRIVPVVAERTQGRPDAAGGVALRDRWRAVAVAALEQSRGAWLTGVGSPVEGLAAALPADVPVEGGAVLPLIAVPGGAPLPDVVERVRAAGGVDEVIVAIGPEGGWTPSEVETAVAAGWVTVGLGPTVLRTEHAGPVAVAVAAALLGRWREAGIGGAAALR